MSPSPRFAVVDVETNGLSPRRHRLLQVAVVVVDRSGAVLDRYSSYVRPRFRWLAGVGPVHVHGITRRHLHDAPRQAEVISQVARRLDGAILVAHNAAFDSEFLRRAARRSSVGMSWSAELCTLRLSRLLDPERTLSHRLGDVCARYGIVVDRPHDALADAEATAALLPRLLDDHDIPRDDADAQLHALAYPVAV